MASPTLSEFIREACSNISILQTQFDHLAERVKAVEYVSIRDRLTKLEATAVELKKFDDPNAKLAERVAILESQLTELKRFKDETEKRQWQFI